MTTPTIPQTAAAGLLSITQPPQTSTPVFKIASEALITFEWSFSGVLATPTSLTLNAVGANNFTYSLTSLPGTATSYVWDPYSYSQSHQSPAVAQTTYILNIFDERGLGVTPSPGYLSPNTALHFALYDPQSYTPLPSGDCAICNGSSSPTAHPAYVAIIATFLVAVLSGFGLIRRTVAFSYR